MREMWLHVWGTRMTLLPGTVTLTGPRGLEPKTKGVIFGPLSACLQAGEEFLC